MRLKIRGKGSITLTKSDFKASGGEGSIYVKGATAYKIFTDPARMIPEAKISELSALSDPSIIRPQDVVIDTKGAPVGYSMRYVDDAFPLCKMFPVAFRNRTGITPERVVDLVERLKASVIHVHSRGILLVDLNEMNVAVATNLDGAFFLDVDSYQTRSFPATAIMDSIRDRHATSFDTGTDWFAFAIVTFQMFVGIHPYKGTYPPFIGTVDKDQRLDARMRSNISVLHDGVTVPAATLPFDVIPPAYLEWYRVMFEDGLRIGPPDAPRLAIRAAPVSPRVSGATVFDVFEIFEYSADVVAVWGDIVLTADGVYAGRRRLSDADGNVAIGCLPAGNVVVGTHSAGRLRLHDATDDREIGCDVAANALMTVDGRFYAKQGPSIVEIVFLETGPRILVTPRVACSVLEHATELYDGVAMENLLGAWYALLFPAAGTCHQVRLRELDNYTILEARYTRSVLVVAATRGGNCDTLVFRFDSGFREYDLRVASSGNYVGIELAVLASGVCLLLNESDEIEVFSNRPGDTTTRAFADTEVRGDARLFSRGLQALFARGRTLYGFRMR
jgi:hypothetical protein